MFPATVLGGALALWRGDRLAGWVHGGVIVAALCLVSFALLPHALGELGAVALLPLGLAYVAVGLAERAVGHRPALAGLAALTAIHQGLDGVQLGAFGAALGPAVALSLGLHGVPLLAVALGAIGERAGRRAAVGFWLACLAAMGCGIAAGSVVPSGWVEPAEPWLKALVGGVLLHVAIDGVRGWLRPGSPLHA
jgi:hypothetical protein